MLEKSALTKFYKEHFFFKSPKNGHFNKFVRSLLFELSLEVEIRIRNALSLRIMHL